ESQGFTLTAVGGTPQTSVNGTTFTNPLTMTVTAKGSGEPVNLGVVSFAINPAANGATANLSALSAVIGGGQASIIATPYNGAGSYTVVASATGCSPSVSFALTNDAQTRSIPAAPQTYTVTNTNDSGAGSLRAAVQSADADTYSGTAFDTIVFNTATI